MTELDERLAAALREAVPEQPRQLDPESIRARSGGRRRTLRRYAPAMAAAAVIAIAVGIALTRGGGSGGTDNKPTVTGHPADLFGVVWRVQTIDGVHAGRFEAVAFDIKPNGTYSQNLDGCDGLDGKLSWTRSDLFVKSAHRFFGDCPMVLGQPRPGGHLAKVMEQLFSGRIAWSLDGNRLTLSKDGGPTIVYTRWRPQGEAGSFNAQIVLDQTTAPANGQPIMGSLIVDNETGAPIVISDACNGWYAVGLANDQVNFEPGWGQVGCPNDQLPLGVTTIPISVDTSYDGCAMPGGQPPTPACIGPEHNRMPPLPPGEYKTKVEFIGLSQNPTVAPPVSVTLTAP